VKWLGAPAVLGAFAATLALMAAVIWWRDERAHRQPGDSPSG